jgi:ADP-ribosyl-[dinitrogen reductase] hydrolase
LTRRLTAEQVDRAAGVLLGMACGDAHGAPYEFGAPLGPDEQVAMTGGGSFGWAPGEWTDDTSMAIAIAEVAATGADLRAGAARDQIAARWAGWAADTNDVGAQTRALDRGVAERKALESGVLDRCLVDLRPGAPPPVT